MSAYSVTLVFYSWCYLAPPVVEVAAADFTQQKNILLYPKLKHVFEFSQQEGAPSLSNFIFVMIVFK